MDGRTKLCVRKDFAFHMIQSTSIYDLTDRSNGKKRKERKKKNMDHGPWLGVIRHRGVGPCIPVGTWIIVSSQWENLNGFI